MNQTVTPGVDNVERAQRMARHRTANKKEVRFGSRQLELPGMNDAEKENARLQPGANQLQIIKSN